MCENSLLNFIKDLLTNFHIHTTLIDYSEGKITTDVDLGLRRIIYGVENYETVLSNSLSQTENNIIYRFSDEHKCNYIFLKFPNQEKYFFVGPYLLNPLTEKLLKNLFAEKRISQEIFNQIVTYYNRLPIVEDENFLLGILNTFAKKLWGNTENFRMEYVEYPIADAYAPMAIWNYPTSNPQSDSITLSNIEQNYNNENFLINAVSKGELHKLNAIASSVFNNGTEERISDSLRNRKNYLIILNTLLRKAAEKGGVHPYNIHIFSSEYAKKIEKIYSISQSLKLQSEMIREYCMLVRNKSIKHYSFYVGKAITLISYDLTAPLTLKNIAKELKVNASYLSSLFSKECGCTLTDYIINQRVEESMRLLMQTDKNVLQIATECGFNDVHYFIRCFKKKNGLTPTAYRKAVKR